MILDDGNDDVFNVVVIVWNAPSVSVVTDVVVIERSVFGGFRTSFIDDDPIDEND